VPVHGICPRLPESRVRTHPEAPADGDARTFAWAGRQAPRRRVWAFEGTGNFAAGQAVEHALAGEDAGGPGCPDRIAGSTGPVPRSRIACSDADALTMLVKAGSIWPIPESAQ
jgi:hypothetical protein